MTLRPATVAALLAVSLGLFGCAAPGGRAPGAAPERRSTPEVAPHPRVADLLVSAIGLVGVPYRLGGNTVDNGFDCSGFTRHLFQAHLDVMLPRRSHEQAGAAGFVDVPRSELQPGDLVFFNTLRRENSHVGIYIGDGRFIHAPRTGANVRLEALGSSYWRQRFDGARRMAAFAPPAAAETSAAR
jgi:cell wall-associated NlpC family hydrolase